MDSAFPAVGLAAEPHSPPDAWGEWSHQGFPLPPLLIMKTERTGVTKMKKVLVFFGQYLLYSLLPSAVFAVLTLNLGSSCFY